MSITQGGAFHGPTPTGTPRPTNTPSPAPPGDGDATGESIANAVDGVIVLQLSAGMTHSIDQDADVNDDGRTDALDAELIQQFVGGLMAHLPV